MTGYTRQSSGDIVTDNVIQASHFNNEFNALEEAFHEDSGHAHDGSTGSGPQINLTTSVTSTLPIGNGGTNATTAAAARTSLGVAIGEDVQAYHPALESIAGLTTEANNIIYTTAEDTYAVSPISSYGRSLIDDSDAVEARDTLGLTIGTDVQAYDAGLASIAGLTTTENNMLYTTGPDSYATTVITPFARTILDDTSAGNVRTTLELGTISTQNKDSVDITGGSLSGVDVAGGTLSGDTILSSYGTEEDPSISFEGDLDTGIYRPDSNTFAISSGGVENLRIVDGKVRINPEVGALAATLTVNRLETEAATNLSETRAYSTLLLKTSGSTSGILTFGALATGSAAYIQRSNGPASSAFPIILQPFGGNVGIGTGLINPDVRLVVADTNTSVQMRVGATLEGISNPRTRWTGRFNSVNFYGDIGLDVSSGQFVLYAPRTSSPTIRAIAIDGDGAVLLGASSNNRALQGCILRGDNATMSITRSPGASVNALSYYRRLDSNGTVLFFERDAEQVGSISVTTTGTTYNQTSDYRLKDITGPVTESGSFIDSLKPKKGFWKIDGSPFVGFLAHEFQQVSPSSVTGDKDAVDDEGNPIYQTMQASTSEVMANIVAELQSLRIRVRDLETVGV